MKSLSAAFLLFHSLTVACQARDEYHFDLGPKNSVVQQGFERLSAETAYSEETGYGWISGARQNITSPKPKRNRTKWWHLDPHFFYDDMATDLRVDGIESEGPLSLRMDVPQGRYRVTATVGHLNEPRYSIRIRANGKLAARDIDARHWLSSERGMLYYCPGYYKRVRFSVDVGREGLVLEFDGDDSAYRKLLAIEKAKSPDTWPKSEAKGSSLPAKHFPFKDIGGPFTKITLMGVEVYPEIALPLGQNPETLKLVAEQPSAELRRAIESFNSNRIAESERLFAALNDPLASGLGLLSIVGRCDYQNERTNTNAAVESLRKAYANSDRNGHVGEILRSAEIFQSAIEHYLTRGEPPKNALVQTWRSIAEFDQTQPDDLFYYKSILWQGRFLIALDPHRWAWHGQEGMARMRKVEEKFPENRFVKYHLYKDWENYGDGTHCDDWNYVDYTHEVADAPHWVREIYPAFRNLIDWCEWWIKFRQASNGGIGGGWGDDVEIVGAFGYMGYISRGMSDTLVKGTGKLVNGVWHESEVDPELGYCLPNADSEHTAEWTGNTLGMMVQIDYGNLVWIERSMKTGKLMRDLWTDYNARGNRHFRANFFGAAQIGSGDQMNDSAINYRAIRPAMAVLWYNRNPAIRELVIDLADSWVDVAMSTERGKPRGVIPAQVGWPDGTLGGVNAPNWWTSTHSNRTVNADWAPQPYKSYIVDLLLAAYVLTRDVKYIEPLRLEYELASKYGCAPTETKSGVRLQQTPDIEQFGKPNKVHQRSGGKSSAAKIQGKTNAQPGSEEWVAAHLRELDSWILAQKLQKGRQGPLENDTTRADIIHAGRSWRSDMAWRWPRNTTEAGPTDRIAFIGLVNPFIAYTGGRIGGPLLEAAVTYDDTTRKFAAAVLGTDNWGFRLLYYNLTADTREIGIIPWHLEPGHKYLLKYGVDKDGDDLMDSIVEQREFDFPQLGTIVRIRVEPKKTYVVEVDQVKRTGRVLSAAEPSSEKAAPPEFALVPDPAISDSDIRLESHFLLARVHNVGSQPIRQVEVVAYDGNPEDGGKLIGRSVIPNIEAPVDLEPRTTTIGFHWEPSDVSHDVYVIIDPDGKIENEITTFNNVAHRTLPMESRN